MAQRFWFQILAIVSTVWSSHVCVPASSHIQRHHVNVFILMHRGSSPNLMQCNPTRNIKFIFKTERCFGIRWHCFVFLMQLTKQDVNVILLVFILFSKGKYNSAIYSLHTIDAHYKVKRVAFMAGHCIRVHSVHVMSNCIDVRWIYLILEMRRK